MRNVSLLLVLLPVFTACEPAVDTTDLEPVRLRIATFNIAMGLNEEGQLTKNLASGQDTRLQQVAEILQRVRPDILLLNEFDYTPDHDAADLFNKHYLAQSWNGQQPIEYAFSFDGPVNTGVDSGLDLDGNGATGDPQDAWGFGRFPGQYGMMVLSRFPIDLVASRTFQYFPRSALPGALRPLKQDGSGFHPDEIWQQLRLSSKSHWDLQIDTGAQDLHFLVHHPTPSVFDGPEDRNGTRNHDENRFWVEYLATGERQYIIDDQGRRGGLGANSAFVVAGDLNADPHDGDSVPGAIQQLLQFELINSSCTPQSTGAAQAAATQGGISLKHKGDPANDTSDFNDQRVGNLRLDYVLPSKHLVIRGCGVFWPAPGEAGHELVEASDHRLVWLDVSL
jgi:endonuclease/exonuclease/phosphatase family metal-dependent hydrolase